LTSGPAVEAHPAFSPDGRYLAYISDQGGDMDVWVTDLESVGSRRLTDLPGGEAYPVFSPDGARIAFFAEQVGRFLRSQIRIVDLTTGGTSPALSATMPPVQLDWSPDGERLTGLVLDPNSTRFREGSFRLFELTVANGNMELFGPLGEQTMFHARPSPDGRWLAWVADARLWLAPFDGGRVSGDKRPLTEGLADWPTWAGDSKSLSFLAGDRLRRVTLDGEIEDLPIELDWLPQGVPGPTVVHAGRLFDGRAETVRTNVDVVIQGGRIRAIEPHSDARHVAVRVIDAAERTVMPGLFEMHGHQGITTGEVQGRRWLAFGVTSVREPGTGPYDGAERRESWASGRRIGPRNFFSGWLLDGGRVYYSLAEGTKDMEHLERALERARLIGYDLLKTYVRLPDAAQKRALAAAHEMGIPTSSHEIFPAAATGMDAVEHASATSRRGYSPKMSLLGRVYDDVIEIVAKSGLNMTPTLVLPCFWPHLAASPQVLENPAVQVFLSEAERQSHLSRGESMLTPATAARCAATRSVSEIVARGGRITAGTDSPIVPYGLALHVELQLLVEAGLSPFEALRSATLWAAEAVGVGADLGSIEVGKLADLIVVEGDPLANIADSINVVVTLKGGRAYTREALFVPSR
jgi:imidazolonepropionase-like amidohydrolase